MVGTSLSAAGKVRDSKVRDIPLCCRWQVYVTHPWVRIMPVITLGKEITACNAIILPNIFEYRPDHSHNDNLYNENDPTVSE